MGTLRRVDFVQQGDRFVSDAVQLQGECAAVEIRLPQAGTLTLERGIAGVSYCPVKEFSLTVDVVDVFNISGGVSGQFVRIVCSVEPVSCLILL